MRRISSNSNNEVAMGYGVSHKFSWASKYSILNVTKWGSGPGKPSNYLIAHPEIPIGNKEALAVAFGESHYLVIGLAMLRDIPRTVMMHITPRQTPRILSPTAYPCLRLFHNYYQGFIKLSSWVSRGQTGWYAMVMLRS